MDDLTPVLVLGVIGYFILALVRTVMDNRLRHILVEKGLADDKVKALFEMQPSYDRHSSLKWGMVSVGVGIAFLIGQLRWIPEASRAEFTAGAIFSLAGLGLILYYFIARHANSSAQE